MAGAVILVFAPRFARAQSQNSCCPDSVDLRVTKSGATTNPLLTWSGGISAEYFITRSLDPKFEPVQNRFLPDATKPEKDLYTVLTLTDSNAPGPPAGSTLYFYRVQDRNSRAYEQTYPFDETIISYTHQCSNPPTGLPTLVNTDFRKIATSHIRIPNDTDGFGTPLTRTFIIRALIRWYEGPPNTLCTFRIRWSPVHPGHDSTKSCYDGCTVNQFNRKTPSYLSPTFSTGAVNREYPPEAFSFGEFTMAWPHYGEWDVTLEGRTEAGTGPVVLGHVLLHTVGIPNTDVTFPPAPEQNPAGNAGNAAVGAFAGTWTKLIETSTFTVPALQTVNVYAQAYAQWQNPSDPATTNEFKFQLTNVTGGTNTDMDTFSVHTPMNLSTGPFEILKQDGRHFFDLWKGVTAGAAGTVFKVSLWARNLQGATSTIGPARIMAVGLHDQLITAKTTRLGDHAFSQDARQWWDGAIGPNPMFHPCWEPGCASYYDFFWWTELAVLNWTNPNPTAQYGTWPSGFPRYYTHGLLHDYIKWTGGTPTTGYPSVPLQLMIAHFQDTTTVYPLEFGYINAANPESSVSIATPTSTVPASSIDSLQQVSDWSGITTAICCPVTSSNVSHKLWANLYTCCGQGTTAPTQGVIPTPLVRPSDTIFHVIVFPEEIQQLARLTTATQCHVP